jgi:hypothetical protein
MLDAIDAGDPAFRLDLADALLEDSVISPRSCLECAVVLALSSRHPVAGAPTAVRDGKNEEHISGHDVDD